jgi:protein arginine kinase
MMHLPGLRLLNEIERVVKGLERIGLAVRGLQGEGSDAVGDMFQVSNQTTLGETEKAIVADLVERIRELVEHEQNARRRLLEDRKTCLLDQIGRSYGVLLNAHVLTSHEAVDMLSALRLGVEFQMVQNLTVGRIHEIILLTQPGHLQKMAGRAMDPDERDEIRARFIRQELSDVCLVDAGRKRRSSGRRRQVKKNA